MPEQIADVPLVTRPGPVRVMNKMMMMMMMVRRVRERLMMMIFCLHTP